jgi:iron complex outermembrane recepter protein
MGGHFELQCLRLTCWIHRSRTGRLFSRSPVQIALVCTLAAPLSAAYALERPAGDLADMSLEQLGDVIVTSVTRQPEHLLNAAASIYVISAEDIRRSGANTLPEALRLAPNLQVARVNANTYAISARGFNNAIGNKLLVLIDGRTVYTPLFSGVDWDAQDVMLEDIERIEVISGPGATLWGANAVNGVINIITRTAAGTQGNLAAGGGGNRETAGAVRHGGTFGDDGHYRIYAKGFSEFHTDLPDGASAHDRFDRGQIGFRADEGGAASNMTLQGDAYDGQSDPDVSGRPTLSGANLLGRWNKRLDNGSNLQFQTYFDHTERNDPFTYFDRVDQFDAELQHTFNLASNQKFIWGGGYRYGRDSTETHYGSPSPFPQAFLPARLSLDWGNLFAQDEIALSPSLNLTLGIKAEYNIFTHMEYLPNARVSWKASDDAVLWAAASRAVRAPAVIDRDFFLYLTLPHAQLLPIIVGGPGFQSEVAHVYELGYRVQPAASVSFSVTGFYSLYDKLRSGEPAPYAEVQNMMYGTTEGIEAWGTWQVLPAWRLSAGLLGMHEDLRIRPGSTDPTGPSALGNDPNVQWQLRSTHNISDNLEFDIAARHVGQLPNPAVPAYTAVDMRVGWHINRSTDLSLSGQDLFDPRHIEFTGNLISSASVVQRGVFLKMQWRD